MTTRAAATAVAHDPAVIWSWLPRITCDAANVKPLTPLFALTGSAPVHTTALAVPNFVTPSPTPAEPVTYTSHTESTGGWSVVPAPVLGTNDNSLGAVAGDAPNDVWAVGNFLPDTPSSNQDATLSLAMHFDGTRWVSTPIPNAGPNFNTLFGVSSAQHRAWAVGVHLNSDFKTRGLVESWDPASAAWQVVRVPQPGAERDLFFGTSALSDSDVWAVGEQQGSDGKFGSLIEHWNGGQWQVVSSPDPGSSGNHLYGVLALAPDNVWAVGQRNDAGSPDHELIVHWDGQRWSVLPSANHGTASAALYAVTADRDGLWAVGETTDANAGGHPLVEHFAADQHPDVVSLLAAGSVWTTLWGVAAADDVVWPVGTFVNLTTDNNQTLVLRGDDRFHVVNAPNPGSGTNILAGAAAIGDTVWAVGHFDDGGSRLPLIERHVE